MSKRKKKSSKKQGAAVSALRTSISLVTSPKAIVPERTVAVVRYQEAVGLAGGANTYAYSSYSMNSPYDALYSVGGGACTGFNEWMALYSRFFVLKCRISISIYNGSSNVIMSYLLPMRSDDAAGGVTPTVDKILEGRDSRYAMIWPGAHPSNGRALTVTYRPAQFEGLPVTSNRDELSGTVASDPQIQPAVQAGWFHTGATTQLSNSMVAVVEYTTEFYRPRLLGDA